MRRLIRGELHLIEYPKDDPYVIEPIKTKMRLCKTCKSIFNEEEVIKKTFEEVNQKNTQENGIETFYGVSHGHTHEEYCPFCRAKL